MATQRSLSFPSGDDACDATLHLPDDGEGPFPVIVMAHGFGAEWAFGLGPFAERFADAGMVVLAFDYRGFGASTGQPRYVVDAARHAEDYEAALEALVTVPEVDNTRVALWGTSYSGGHALVVASRHPELRAVSCMVPFVDGIASTRVYPARWHLPAAVAGIRDVIGAALGREPLYVPIVGDRLCALSGQDAVDGYNRLMPADSNHPGHVAARVFLTLPRYRPIRIAARVRAPVLVIGAEHDTLIPIAAVRRAAAQIPDCTLEEMPIGHFDPYFGSVFETVVQRQADFLADKLGVPSPATD